MRHDDESHAGIFRHITEESFESIQAAADAPMPTIYDELLADDFLMVFIFFLTGERLRIVFFFIGPLTYISRHL